MLPNQVRVTREENAWLYGVTSLGDEVNISCWQLRFKTPINIGDILAGSFYSSDLDQLTGRSHPDPEKDLYFIASSKVS